MTEGYVDITGDSGTAFMDTWGGLIEGVRI